MKKIGNAEKLMTQMAELVTPKIRDDEFTASDFIEKFKMPARTKPMDSTHGTYWILR